MLESLKYSVVAECGDSVDLAGVVSQFRPDVLLVEFAMSPLDGAEVARTVRDKVPSTPVIVLDGSDSETHAVQALRSGASAYVAKSAHPKELPQAIEAAIHGEKFVSSPLPPHPLHYWVHRAERGDFDVYDTLTIREREVLRLVGEAASSTTIARRLAISRRTVEAHRANIRRKLRIGSHAGLLRYALQRQLKP